MSNSGRPSIIDRLGLGPQVLERHAAGQTSAQVATWVSHLAGEVVGARAVRAWVAKHGSQKTRAETRQAAIGPKAPTLGEQWDARDLGRIPGTDGRLLHATPVKRPKGRDYWLAEARAYMADLRRLYLTREEDARVRQTALQMAHELVVEGADLEEE